MKKEYEKKTPTYAKVIAGILAGLMTFSAIATVLIVLLSQ